MAHTDHRIDFNRLPGAASYHRHSKTVVVPVNIRAALWDWTDAELEALDATDFYTRTIARLRPGYRIVECGEDDCVGIRVPALLAVCDVCDGGGSVVSPSVDANGITEEEFAEDEGFREAYMAGAYDVVCPKCEGQRVYPAIDDERDPVAKAVKAFVAAEDDERIAEDIADRRTRYMESGGFDC